MVANEFTYTKCRDNEHARGFLCLLPGHREGTKNALIKNAPPNQYTYATVMFAQLPQDY